MNRKLAPKDASLIRTLHQHGMKIADLHRTYPQVSFQRIAQIAKFVPAPPKPPRPPKIKPPTMQAQRSGERRAQVLDYVRAHPRCRQTTIAHYLNMTIPTTHVYATQLRMQGLIEFAPGSKDLIATDHRPKPLPAPAASQGDREKVLDYVRAHPRCRQNAMIGALGLSETAVHLFTKALRREGLITFAPGSKDLIAAEHEAA